MFFLVHDVNWIDRVGGCQPVSNRSACLPVVVHLAPWTRGDIILIYACLIDENFRTRLYIQNILTNKAGKLFDYSTELMRSYFNIYIYIAFVVSNYFSWLYLRVKITGKYWKCTILFRYRPLSFLKVINSLLKIPLMVLKLNTWKWFFELWNRINNRVCPQSHS